MSTEQEQDAWAALDAAIEACHAITQDDRDVAVDAVLVIGCQTIDNDGDRIGNVEVFPRRGSQPSYVTRGLLEEATTLIHRNTD
jgi:hypothetical protein